MFNKMLYQPIELLQLQNVSNICQVKYTVLFVAFQKVINGLIKFKLNMIYFQSQSCCDCLIHFYPVLSGLICSFQTKSMVGPHEISTTSSAADIQLLKRGIQTSPDGKTSVLDTESKEISGLIFFLATVAEFKHFILSQMTILNLLESLKSIAEFNRDYIPILVQGQIILRLII